MRAPSEVFEDTPRELVFAAQKLWKPKMHGVLEKEDDVVGLFWVDRYFVIDGEWFCWYFTDNLTTSEPGVERFLDPDDSVRIRDIHEVNENNNVIQVINRAGETSVTFRVATADAAANWLLSLREQVSIVRQMIALATPDSVEMPGPYAYIPPVSAVCRLRSSIRRNSILSAPPPGRDAESVRGDRRVEIQRCYCLRDSSALQQRYTVYLIYVIEANLVLERRYRDFLCLWEQLVQLDDKSLMLPALPPKKVFGNLDPWHVEYRRDLLEDFLHSVIELFPPFGDHSRLTPAMRIVKEFLYSKAPPGKVLWTGEV